MYTRIKKNNDFKKLFSRGKKFFSPALIILYLPSDRLSMGLCVSKKHGKSVRRNRIKRLLREAFRKTAKDFGGVKAAVLLLPKQAEDYSFARFEREIRAFFAKLAEGKKCAGK